MPRQKQIPPFKRECPSCGKIIEHASRQNRNTAKRLKRICKACENSRRVQAYSGKGNPFYGKKHSEETIARFQAREHPHTQTDEFRRGASERLLERNPMKGRSVYQLWIDKLGKEKADKLMDARRKKSSIASSGESNPMYGRPTPQGSGNGWSGWYKGWFFRSFRELSYMINVIEANNYSWESAETAELTVPYVDHKGDPRTYRADFLINKHILVEVKPVKLHNTPLIKAKSLAAIAFCEKIGLEYKIVDPPLLSDTVIADLYSSGAIRFTERYEAKFIERKHAK